MDDLVYIHLCYQVAKKMYQGRRASRWPNEIAGYRIWGGTEANPEQQTVSNQRKWKDHLVLSFRPWRRESWKRLTWHKYLNKVTAAVTLFEYKYLSKVTAAVTLFKYFVRNILEPWQRLFWIIAKISRIHWLCILYVWKSGKAKTTHMKLHLILNWSGKNTKKQTLRPFPKHTAVIQLQHAFKTFNLTTLLQSENATIFSSQRQFGPMVQLYTDLGSHGFIRQRCPWGCLAGSDLFWSVLFYLDIIW